MNLSNNNNIKKEEYEHIIAQNDKRYIEIDNIIKRIRNSKKGQYIDTILELQIEQERIEQDTTAKEEAITKLYIKEMKENLIERKKHGEISADEFSNEMRIIKECREMVTTTSDIENIEKELTILDMKLQLEKMKKNMKKISKEQADENIAEINKEISSNEEYKQIELENLAKQYFEHKRKNLYYQRKSGQISSDELKRKLEELEKTREYIPTEKEITKMLNDLIQKHLGQLLQSQEYKRRISSRDYLNTSSNIKKLNEQDINKSHEYNVYHDVREYKNKIFKYGIGVVKDDIDYIDYIGTRLGEDYARGISGEKAELAKQFGKLEVKGKEGYFKNPYENGETVSGYDNPKLLLQLEKVKGINIVGNDDDIIGFNEIDQFELQKDIYVATYEIEVWDNKLQKNIMKPIKEYYQKLPNGEMIIIGTGTEERTTITVDGLELNINSNQILQGQSLERVTQQEMADKLIKNSIEASMKNGKVIEIAKITDFEFLKDFAKQCDVPKEWLSDRTFIISTMNEKGEEDFDIVVRDDIPENSKLDTIYEHLTGIQAIGKKSREMYTTNGKELSKGAKEFYKTQSLKEFITKSGHRYAINRNAEGELGLNEIFRENEGIMQAEHIDTYTYSTEDLKKAYRNAGITQEDLNKAYNEINRTRTGKEERDDKRYR